MEDGPQVKRLPPQAYHRDLFHGGEGKPSKSLDCFLIGILTVGIHRPVRVGPCPDQTLWKHEQPARDEATPPEFGMIRQTLKQRRLRRDNGCNSWPFQPDLIPRDPADSGTSPVVALQPEIQIHIAVLRVAAADLGKQAACLLGDDSNSFALFIEEFAEVLRGDVVSDELRSRGDYWKILTEGRDLSRKIAALRPGPPPSPHSSQACLSVLRLP